MMQIMEMLTDKQKKKLLKRITPQVSSMFKEKFEDKYNQLEIYSLTGIKPNRQSEINNYEKYYHNKAVVTGPILSGLIGGGLVDIDKLLRREDLTKAEMAYLETFIIYKNKRLSEAAIALEKAGHNPGDILYEFAKSKNLI